MAMKLTERLKAEHGVFLFQLDHLERLVQSHAPRPVLQAVVETIASAEEHHSAIEDRLLYPALGKVIGRESPLMKKSEREHEEVHKLVDQIRSGPFDETTINAFISLLRKHLEREIHDLFGLADDMLSADDLVSMSNWDVDHLYEANGKRKPWPEKYLG
jgi:hemerythrin-like domain-containing protein